MLFFNLFCSLSLLHPLSFSCFLFLNLFPLSLFLAFFLYLFLPLCCFFLYTSSYSSLFICQYIFLKLSHFYLSTPHLLFTSSFSLSLSLFYLFLLLPPLLCNAISLELFFPPLIILNLFIFSPTSPLLSSTPTVPLSLQFLISPPTTTPPPTCYQSPPPPSLYHVLDH